jgi:hypothetical protein
MDQLKDHLNLINLLILVKNFNVLLTMVRNLKIIDSIVLLNMVLRILSRVIIF